MDDSPGSQGRPHSRPAGKRFRSVAPAGAPASAPVRPHAVRTAARSRHAANPAAPVRPIPTRRTQHRVQRRAKPAVLVIVALIIAAVVAVCILVLPHVLGGDAVEPGREVSLTIPQGSSGNDIADLLRENHVIGDAWEFRRAVDDLDAATSLKPGDYLFQTGEDVEDVVRQLVAGPNVEGEKVTVPEGLTVAQTASLVEKAFGIPADDFVAQAKASEYADDYPFLKGAYDDSLEGYLYPKTYAFRRTPSADQVIRAMLDQFQKETAGLDLDSAPQGLSAQQVVSMASLIERETAVEDERPLIASVIYNRLKADMPLQIDAAIVYARGGGSDGVTYRDLEIDSPYNVYKHKGLTPGPICSPSVSSIKAVLSPADTGYLYYVASSKLDGTHRFSEGYEEFQKNTKEYEAALS